MDCGSTCAITPAVTRTCKRAPKVSFATLAAAWTPDARTGLGDLQQTQDNEQLSTVSLEELFVSDSEEESPPNTVQQTIRPHKRVTEPLVVLKSSRNINIGRPAPSFGGYLESLSLQQQVTDQPESQLRH